MAAAPTTVYRPLYFTAIAVLIAGTVGGFVISLVRDQRLPPVPLNATIDPFMDEARAQVEAGDYEPAIRALSVALELQPERGADGHLLLGRAYMEQEDWGNAVEHFRAATRADPMLAEAYNNLGVTYARMGRHDEGLAALRQALRLAPGWEAALNNYETMRQQAEAGGGVLSGPAASSPEIDAGRESLRLFYRGDLTALATRFTEQFAAQLTPAALEKMHVDIFRQLGAETGVTDEQVIAGRSSKLYKRTASFERYQGAVDVMIELDADGRIRGMQFRPAPQGGVGP